MALRNTIKKHEKSTANMNDSKNMKKSDLGPIISTKKKPHQITYYELLEIERQRDEAKQVKVKIKRNFPIAPDGFIPNSVVLKFFKLLQEEPKRAEKKIWKLKWLDLPNESKNKQPSNETIQVPTYSGLTTTIYDWSSTDEEENLAEEINEDKSDENKKGTLFDGLIDNLKKHDWFKLKDKVFNMENILKYLMGKLAERNTNNHLDVSNYIIHMISNLELRHDLYDWIATEIEAELDASDLDIISNNLRIIEQLDKETYNIDMGLLDLIKDKNYSRDKAFLAQVSGVLMKITRLENENQLNLVISETKKLTQFKMEKN